MQRNENRGDNSSHGYPRLYIIASSSAISYQRRIAKRFQWQLSRRDAIIRGMYSIFDNQIQNTTISY